MSADAQRCLDGLVRIHVADDVEISNHLDQSIAICRRHLSKREIALRRRSRKIGLRNAASSGIAAALDGEKLVDRAIRNGRSRLVDEASFQNRAIRCDERRHRVARTIEVVDREQRIRRRTGTAHRGIRVAAGARVLIESGAKSTVRGRRNDDVVRAVKLRCQAGLNLLFVRAQC